MTFCLNRWTLARISDQSRLFSRFDPPFAHDLAQEALDHAPMGEEVAVPEIVSSHDFAGGSVPGGAFCGNMWSREELDGGFVHSPAAQRSSLLGQVQFALAMGISVYTLRNWEQGRRDPEGPAIALLRIAARHPRIIRENIESAA